MTPEENEPDRDHDRIEVEYIKSKVFQYGSEFGWRIEEENEDDDGWQGLFSCEFEEEGSPHSEMLFVNKPLGAPYVKFEFWLPIEPMFFKSRVKEIIGIISDFGLCLSLDEDLNDPEKLVLQISIRVFVSNYNVETFEYVTENLFACKDALLEYFEEQEWRSDMRKSGEPPNRS